VGSQSVFQYRNKIEYTFSNKRFLLPSELNDPTILGTTNVVGFHARGFFDKVVDIDTCHLQAEPTNQIRLFVKSYAKQHQLSFYDYRLHTGFLRNLQIRICETGQVMVNLIVGENNQSLLLPLLEAIQKEFPSITTLLYTVNLKWNDSIFDLEPIPFTGKGFIEEELLNTRYYKKFRFKIGPRSFFQTNTRQAEKLYQLTEEAAGLTGQETLYDLYCGTGSIGIFMSPGAKKIIGVEQVAAAIDDARENAQLNNLNNTSFFAGDVIDICTSDFFAAQGQADVVITDPPRAGMHAKLIEKLIEIGAPTVVYVSCNPATQARDLQLLDAHYQVTKVQPVDMFPHTHHIENIVQLKRR
jgi:23S rRNA (uracil1939-C5)-methyltransferase